MKVEVKYIKAFKVDEFTNAVGAQVVYNGKIYAVSVTCSHWFEGDEYVVKYIQTFRYLMEPARKSKTRDEAIKAALKKLHYSL